MIIPFTQFFDVAPGKTTTIFDFRGKDVAHGTMSGVVCNASDAPCTVNFQGLPPLISNGFVIPPRTCAPVVNVSELDIGADKTACRVLFIAS